MSNCNLAFYLSFLVMASSLLSGLSATVGTENVSLASAASSQELWRLFWGQFAYFGPGPISFLSAMTVGHLRHAYIPV